ncbi:hypothetical protein TeGR_g7171, partial [Tetraparma gracilis]
SLLPPPPSPLFDELVSATVSTFGAPLSLSPDLSKLEAALLAAPANLWGAYSDSVARGEVGWGLAGRLAPPGAPPPAAGPPAGDWDRTSLLICARGAGSLAGSVELRLQPPDAKIPFSFPLLDSLERSLSSFAFPAPPPPPPQPYLCNLFVLPARRGEGVARHLVRAALAVAEHAWGGFDAVYLHVDPKNKPAVGLYEGEGFGRVEEVEWRPGWEGGAGDIAYYVKRFDRDEEGD